MGRDKVLGLSLAILLIGFAGAFCFRNEQVVENGLKLARAKLLDEGISQRTGPKPYVADPKASPELAAKPTVTLQGIEAIETEAPRTAQRSRQSELGELSTMALRSKSAGDVAEGARPVKDRLAFVETVQTKPEAPVSADKPLEMAIRPSSSPFASPDSLLDDSATWQHTPEGRDGCPALAGPTAASEGQRSGTVPFLTHQVRRGDTLSKIALHYLGDSGRYREIFEANRDQLQNPGARLKVGMTLQIPTESARSQRREGSAVARSRAARSNGSAGGSQSRQASVRPVARTRDLSKTKPTADVPSNSSPVDDPREPAGEPLFVPVSKAPFLRSRGESQPNPRNRDLSQRPPGEESPNSGSNQYQVPGRKTDNDANDES